MRPKTRVKEVRKMIESMLRGEAPVKFLDRRQMLLIHDVLSWVLEDPSHDNFAKNIAQIEALAFKKGWLLNPGAVEQDPT